MNRLDRRERLMEIIVAEGKCQGAWCSDGQCPIMNVCCKAEGVDTYSGVFNYCFKLYEEEYGKGSFKLDLVEARL